jgi:pilus assembly protein CpaB
MKKVKLLALFLAVLTAGALFFFLRPSDDKKDVIPYSNVIVAADDISENTTITADMIKVASVPSATILSNTYSNITAVIGKTASANIMAGEQLVSVRLVEVGSPDSGSLAYAITPGKRAITIGVNDTSSLKNMIKPGDYIDIIALYQIETLADNAKGEEEIKTIPVSKLLLQLVKVLAVDQVIQKTGVEKYTTITLEVTPDQAVLISYSENNGLLRAILRSPLDSVNEDVFRQDG